MRTIDGHFTVINEPRTAHALAAKLLAMFESVRTPEHIIVTETVLEQGALRAQNTLSHSLAQSIKRIEVQIGEIKLPTDLEKYPKVDKAQQNVLEATNKAERASSRKHWKKLDRTRKTLAKQLDKAGFASYTAYVDYINSQGIGGAKRRELLVSRDELLQKKRQAENKSTSLTSLTPSQIITVLADVLSRCPRTPVGPLPIVFDDALRNLETATKLRALEVLKAHSSNYATWYVTDDPLVLGWAGFYEGSSQTSDGETKTSPIFDNEIDVA